MTTTMTTATTTTTTTNTHYALHTIHYLLQMCEAMCQLLDVHEHLSLRDGQGRTPLHTAAMQGYRDTVAILIDMGAWPYIDAQDAAER